MFSLYEIGDFLLAFYTDIPSGPFSAIENVDSNDLIFEIGMYLQLSRHNPLCLIFLGHCIIFLSVADLRLMLQNIVTK